MDTSGSRFLERFAGSSNFENRLNHSKRAPKDYRNAPGDFTRDGENESFDYSVTSAAPDNYSPDSRMGPGSVASNRLKLINSMSQGLQAAIASIVKSNVRSI